MRSYFIETWGCQMNVHDSERLEGLLRRHGLVRSADVEQADLVLLNTCSVREKPVQKILSRIGVLARLPRPPRVGVCGCVAQQEGEALLARSRHVAFVLAPSQIHRLSEALDVIEASDRRPVITGFDRDPEMATADVVRSSATRGMITVIAGCNEHCSFCIVPYTRGHEISRPLTEILAEAEGLAREGMREVELLGQTVNSYRCPATGADLADLLDRVATIPGLARVRFVTSHPRHFSERLIDVLARHRCLSRYLHLPVQAGSDSILRRMRRRYTRAEYVDLVARIRARVPDVNLSTDVIVGFPGESEEDFAQTLDLLREVRFGQVFAFAYSARPKTPAERYPETVSEELKMDRLARLFALTVAISEELNQRLVGATLPVLIDSDSRRSASDWQGRGEDNRVVNFPKTAGSRLGDIVPVRITSAGRHSLVGELHPGTSGSPRAILPVHPV